MKKNNFRVKKNVFLKEVEKTFYTNKYITVCKMVVFIPFTYTVGLPYTHFTFEKKLKKRFPYINISGIDKPRTEGIEFSVIGKSRRNPEDKYNPKTGDILAYSRAQLASYKRALSILRYISYLFAQQQIPLKDARMTCVSLIAREENFLHNFTK